MKKHILLLVTIITLSVTVNAQTKEQIIKNFKTLIVEAKTDFKNVKGELIDIDTAFKITYYDCSVNLGSELEGIGIDNVDGATYHTSIFDYERPGELIKANDIISGIVDEVNVMVKSGKYTGSDYKKTDNIDITEVKDLDGNYIVEIESKYDATNATSNYLKIIIYGKSWGKK